MSHLLMELCSSFYYCPHPEPEFLNLLGDYSHPYDLLLNCFIFLVYNHSCNLRILFFNPPLSPTNLATSPQTGIMAQCAGSSCRIKNLLSLGAA